MTKYIIAIIVAIALLTGCTFGDNKQPPCVEFAEVVCLKLEDECGQTLADPDADCVPTVEFFCEDVHEVKKVERPSTVYLDECIESIEDNKCPLTGDEVIYLCRDFLEEEDSQGGE